MQLREGETVGDYISRLEARVKELEPPEGFTVQEWHVGQVYVYLLWLDDEVRSAARSAVPNDAVQKWRDRLTMFEDRFPEQVAKFANYMGWLSRNDATKPVTD